MGQCREHSLCKWKQHGMAWLHGIQFGEQLNPLMKTRRIDAIDGWFIGDFGDRP